MRLSVITLAVVLASGFPAAVVHAASTTIDTTKAGWVWKGMSEYDDPSLAAGQGRAGGPGSYAAFTIAGTSVSVAMMQAPSVTVDGRGHRVGKVKVVVDGVSKMIANLYSDTPSGNDIVFSTDSLADGNHVVELTAVDGWVIVDHLVVRTGVDTDDSHAGTFHDDFRDGDVTRWTTYGGEWNVVDGYYTCPAGDGSKSVLNNLTFSDMLYQADVYVGKASPSGGDAGLIFRVSHPSIGTDSYTGYYAGLDVAQQRVVLGKASDSWTLLTSTPYQLQPMTTYHLRVYATGSQITIVVNNVPVIHFSDDSFRSGGVGLRTFHIDAGWAHVDVSHP